MSLVEKALKLSKEIYSEKHPITITIMSNLSNTLYDLGRYEESLKLTEQVFTLRKEVLGKWHIKTIMAMYDLAEELQEAGRHKESAALWKERIEMIFTSDENDDVNADNLRDYIDSKFDATDEYDLYGVLQVLNPMIHLAKALLDAGEKDEALSWADNALKFGEKIFPVFIEDNGEVYTEVKFAGMDFEKNLSALRAWHKLFLKKFNGENLKEFDEATKEILRLIKRVFDFNRYDDEED